MDWVTEIGFMVYLESAGKWGFLRQLKQVFFIFLVKFLAYLMIFQSFAASLECLHIEKSSNIAEELEPALNPFLHDGKYTLASKTRNPGFEYHPIHHYYLLTTAKLHIKSGLCELILTDLWK